MTDTKVSGNPLRPVSGSALTAPNAHDASAMTQRRYDALMAALTRADAEWEAEQYDAGSPFGEEGEIETPEERQIAERRADLAAALARQRRLF